LLLDEESSKVTSAAEAENLNSLPQPEGLLHPLKAESKVRAGGLLSLYLFSASRKTEGREMNAVLAAWIDHISNAASVVLPMLFCIPAPGGAGIYACGQAVEEIGFSR